MGGRSSDVLASAFICSTISLALKKECSFMTINSEELVFISSFLYMWPELAYSSLMCLKIGSNLEHPAYAVLRVEPRALCL